MAVSLDKLKASRTRTVKILVDDVEEEFVIQKIKVGQQRRLQTDCVRDDGSIDVDKLYVQTAVMCTVEPSLSEDDVDDIDGDVFVALSLEIAKHSGVSDAMNLIVSGAEVEGASAVKGFPASDGLPGVGSGVDADQGGA